MPRIFHVPSLDNTLKLLREGYPFLQRRHEQYDTDLFRMRLMGQKVICMHGPEAAQLLYDPKRFMRLGAVPRRVQTTLMGKDAIQTLDHGEHRCRKEMFMALMGPGSRHRLMRLLAEQWETYAQKWE